MIFKQLRNTLKIVHGYEQLQASHLCFKQRLGMSTFYEVVKNQHFFQKQYKASSIKFNNQGLKLLVYPSSPTVTHLQSTASDKCHFIPSYKAANMIFLADGEEDMDVWQNRKLVPLDLKDIMKLSKVGPHLPSNLIEKTVWQGEDIFKYVIDLNYNKERMQVALNVEYSKKQGESYKMMWEVQFLLSFNEYETLIQWLRSGLFYTSGAALMVELSKQHILKEQANRQFVQKWKGKDSKKE